MSETLSSPVSFVVEEASCSSCAARVRTALEPLATVESIDLDHEGNAATVRVAPTGELSEEAVNAVLAEASAGSSHTYRVRPGTFGAAA